MRFTLLSRDSLDSLMLSKLSCYRKGFIHKILMNSLCMPATLFRLYLCKFQTAWPGGLSRFSHIDVYMALGRRLPCPVGLPCLSAMGILLSAC